MSFFKEKQTIQEGPTEARFDAMMELIKDLPKADYNRLKEAMDLGYSAYQKVRNVKTPDERDTADFSAAEKLMESEK